MRLLACYLKQYYTEYYIDEQPKSKENQASICCNVLLVAASRGTTFLSVECARLALLLHDDHVESLQLSHRGLLAKLRLWEHIRRVRHFLREKLHRAVLPQPDRLYLPLKSLQEVSQLHDHHGLLVTYNLEESLLFCHLVQFENNPTFYLQYVEGI